jgi:hypothetical protein
LQDGNGKDRKRRKKIIVMKDIIDSIIKGYEDVIKGIEDKALSSKNRAYGGIIRAGKGKLVETIGKLLVEAAVKQLEEEGTNIKVDFRNNPIRIPLKGDYISRIKNNEVRTYLEQNRDRIYYEIKPDLQIYIDGNFKIYMECKAYTENAMLKRILVDCYLVKQIFPDASFILLQLESQLGGDYSCSLTGKFGSPPTHTLLSHFDIDLKILTLLEGERKVDQPIHKAKFYKPLKKERLIEAANYLKELIK